MKLKALLLTMLAAGVATSLALASPPADRGREGRTGTTTVQKPSAERGAEREKKTRERERPRAFTVLLHGEFVSAAGGSFAMVAQRSSKHGRALHGKQLTVLVDERTKVRRLGPAELADLVAGDRLLVLARASKGATGALELRARLVQAKPARAARPSDSPTKHARGAERTKTGTTLADEAGDDEAGRRSD